ncbi:hypothetical protein B1812_19955 [Methylocystis bryophila]|uniref:Uncharacterized protein n=1 Tax=Methylocystis bryophila TaxID=655015 RepID=A0A1W6MZL4_9HYPH|nr:hypothetical protein B1812_19955 [Methylocystis bryophila]
MLNEPHRCAIGTPRAASGRSITGKSSIFNTRRDLKLLGVGDCARTDRAPRLAALVSVPETQLMSRM